MPQKKPELNFWQIWNMCFGFLGIQFGFALQNSNYGRIFETLGADYSNMAIILVAAPLTGLIVQPIIGYLSDNTWNRFGRRRPYFLIGAVASTLSLFIFPNSPTLWFAAGMLWIMDASINITMEPTRAFVGDMLPKSQRGKGYSMQVFFIGVGAMAASASPWIMTNWFDVSNTAVAGTLPDSVKYAFYIGGVVLLIAVFWTIFSTKEYSPKQMEAFEAAELAESDLEPIEHIQRTSSQYFKMGSICTIIGVISSIVTIVYVDDINLLVLTGGITAFGICQLIAGLLEAKNSSNNGFSIVMNDLFSMPEAMRKLAPVQFFSWFPFFTMWAYITSAITSHHYGTTDPTSQLYNEGANWVGILSAVYNSVPILAAMLIPIAGRKFSLRYTHMFNLCLGGLGFISIIFIADPKMLVISMVGIGFAWASMLGVPYALLSNALPSKKMGMYMGIFNYFIVLPQLLAGATLGFLITRVFDNQPIYAMALAGASLLVAAALTLRVDKNIG